MDGYVDGPLEGIRVVELGGIGPAPFCSMMLADLGADVTVIARDGRVTHPVLDRGKRIISANLKSSSDAETVHELLKSADVVIEGFRPGVAERLGFGPENVVKYNERIVYGRITGFGRSGPLSERAGHDINYISMSGVLGTLGEESAPPPPPLNLIADFGGGGLLLAVGIIAALHRVRTTGRGEIVDSAMVDGSALLMGMIYGFHAQGRWSDDRGSNLLDGGAPFYRTYRCADGRFVAIGAIEAEFFVNLVRGLELEKDLDVSRQNDKSYWPVIEDALERKISQRSRDYWEEKFSDIDGCLTPVLALNEVSDHPHNIARGVFSKIDGGIQPNSAPHFSPLPAPDRTGTLEGTRI